MEEILSETQRREANYPKSHSQSVTEEKTGQGPESLSRAHSLVQADQAVGFPLLTASSWALLVWRQWVGGPSTF